MEMDGYFIQASHVASLVIAILFDSTLTVNSVTSVLMVLFQASTAASQYAQLQMLKSVNAQLLILQEQVAVYAILDGLLQTESVLKNANSIIAYSTIPIMSALVLIQDII